MNNNPITMNEDFTPFELAVKLKEKGYPQDDFIGYDEFGTLCIGDEHSNVCASPTISQVLKWLREVKGIHITVLPLWEGYYAEVFTKVRWETDDTHQRGLCFNIDKCIYKNETYEAAALAGIEYVLDNLI